MTGPTHCQVTFRRLDPRAQVPTYSTEGDAGADLTSIESYTLGPGERALVPTGLAIALPPGTVGLVHPRSGLAVKHGITVLNAPGTIDAGYRGEVRVPLINLDRAEPFTINVGDRIAQLVIQSYLHADFVEADSLPPSQRGETGFGSTGGFSPPSPGVPADSQQLRS